MKLKDYIKIGFMAAYLGLVPMYAQNSQANTLEKNIKEKQRDFMYDENNISKALSHVQKGDSLLAEALKDNYFSVDEQFRVYSEYESAQESEKKFNGNYFKKSLIMDKEHETIFYLLRDNLYRQAPTDMTTHFRTKYNSEIEDHFSSQDKWCLAIGGVMGLMILLAMLKKKA